MPRLVAKPITIEQNTNVCEAERIRVASASKLAGQKCQEGQAPHLCRPGAGRGIYLDRKETRDAVCCPPVRPSKHVDHLRHSLIMFCSRPMVVLHSDL